MQSIRSSKLIFPLLLLTGAMQANAVHLDVELRGEGDELAVGFCITKGVGCDLPSALGKLGLAAGVLPVDWESGQQIFVADFADFPRPSDTANPGFHAVDGALQPGELIRYEAMDALHFWDPGIRQWGAADAHMQVRLFGGMEAKTLVHRDTSHCDGLLICIPKEIIEKVYEEASTVFLGSGIQGAASLLIDNANSKGSLHTHLDWFLEDSAGKAGGPTGAYLVGLRLLSDQRSQASAPFLVAFNNGLGDDDFASAIAARMQPPSTPAPSDSPAPSTLPSASPVATPGPSTPPSASPASSPAPSALPSASPVPGPEPETAEVMPIGQFAYTEQAAEKLRCASQCSKVVRGSTLIKTFLPFERGFASQLLAHSTGLTLELGVLALKAAWTPPRGGKPARLSKIRRVTDHRGARVGTVLVNVSGKGLRLQFRLHRPLFGETFLEDDGPGRKNRVESLALGLFSQGEVKIAGARSTLLLTLNEQANGRKTIRRKGNSFTLNRVVLKATITD